MKERFLVLRRVVTPSTPPAGAEAATTAARTLPDVQIHILDRRDVPELRSDPGVRAVAPSMPVRLITPVQRSAAPAATGPTWGVQAVRADTSPRSGAGVVVAVLDTGIDVSHPAFSGVTLIRRDFTGPDDAEGGVDDQGHGTHCAGTIFGRDVEGQRIGVARGVERALIGKVLGSNGGGTSEGIARAITWATQQGAHVISMSLGMDFPGLVAQLITQGLPPELATSRALVDYRANLDLFGALADYARAFGGDVVPTQLVAAAGNESRRQQDPDWEVSVAPPATADGFTSVAAVGLGSAGRPDQGLVVAPFSNTGATVAGPGVGVVSAQMGGGLVAYSGTSMATPHVAGVTALWVEALAAAGDLTRLTLETAVRGHATRAPLVPDVDRLDVGLGLVQAPQT